jgi:uncharacterized membrane protein
MILLTIIGMIIATFVGAVGSVFLKKGSARFKIRFSYHGIIAVLKNYTLIFGVFLYVLSAIIFIYLLRSNELSVLYPLTALSYVFVTLLSIYYLKESMNFYKWLGVSCIIIGVVFVTL